MRLRASTKDETVEVRTRIGEEFYYGYSSLSREYALMDLLSDIPEHVAIRIEKKAGMIA